VITSLESPKGGIESSRSNHRLPIKTTTAPHFAKVSFDDYMEIGTRADGVDVEKHLLAELVFEVINQPSGMTGGIGAPVADKYSYVLTGF
jgi:hypothetical protein